jgi:type I restriction enzyme S subunit
MKAGWKTVRLNDVCDIVKGRKPNLRTTPNKGDLPYLVARYIRGLEDPEYGSPLEKGVVTLTEADTVIICDGSNSGEVFTGLNGIMSSTMGKVVKKTEIYDPYLRHFLSSTFELFNGTKTGSAIPHLDKDAFRKLEIPLPTLAEQKRVVALLDEAFAGIDDAKAKAEACELSALNLFKSRMQDVYNVHNQAWAKKRLADVADFKNGLNFTRQSNGQTLQMVGVGDFQDRSTVPTQALQSVTIDGNIPDDYLLRRNDILTVRSNGSKDLVGRCMLVPELSAPTSFSGFIIRIRLDTSAVSPRFFLHFMKSSGTRDRLMRVGGGANISNINQAKLSELPVALPPLAQQEEIADQLDGHHELSLILANQYRQKIAAIDSLRTSALQRAFAGELTA